MGKVEIYNFSAESLGIFDFYFLFQQIRTLVAMATYSFHGLIMGRVEIDNFC